jgi:hypothetical protein
MGYAVYPIATMAGLAAKGHAAARRKDAAEQTWKLAKIQMSKGVSASWLHNPEHAGELAISDKQDEPTYASGYALGICSIY